MSIESGELNPEYTENKSQIMRAKEGIREVVGVEPFRYKTLELPKKFLFRNLFLEIPKILVKRH